MPFEDAVDKAAKIVEASKVLEAEAGCSVGMSRSQLGRSTCSGPFQAFLHGVATWKFM